MADKLKLPGDIPEAPSEEGRDALLKKGSEAMMDFYIRRMQDPPVVPGMEPFQPSPREAPLSVSEQILKLVDLSPSESPKIEQMHADSLPMFGMFAEHFGSKALGRAVMTSGTRKYHPKTGELDEGAHGYGLAADFEWPRDAQGGLVAWDILKPLQDKLANIGWVLIPEDERTPGATGVHLHAQKARGTYSQARGEGQYSPLYGIGGM